VNEIKVKEEIPESPDYLAIPKKGEGQQKPNRLPIVIVGTVMLVVMLGLVVEANDRSLENQQAAIKDAEIRRISAVAVPPVKRPAGPDVGFSAGVPIEAGQVYTMGQSPMPIDEAAKQAQAKKVAALDAALNAPAEVEKFSAKQQQRQTTNPPRTGYASNPGPRIDGQVPPPPPDPDGENYAGDTNQQDRKRAFLEQSGESGIYLKHTREVALAQNQLNAGAIIPGVMMSGINSDLPGQIIGQVRQNVYDSATGRILLIPAGARLVGRYDSEVSAGQERVLVAWNRVMFPDGSSLSLDGMPGADQSGFAGFNDKVDNHYWRTFGNAFMLSLFSAGIQLSQPRGAVTGTYNSQQIMAAALGQQLGMLGMQTARRNLSIQPTLEIRPGYLFDIMVTKDIILPPWTGHPLQQNRANRGTEAETTASGSYQQVY
jgi:type IV secretion system protein VirB10